MTEKSRRHWGRWVGVLVLLGVIGWGGSAFWGGESQGVLLSTVEVDRGELRQTVLATGQLNPVRNVEVGSQLSGIIDEILVDFNSEVSRGEVLARLETSTFEANLSEAEGQVALAESALELAEIEIDRLRRLRDRNLVPQSEIDRAEATLRQAEATLSIRTHAMERARSELERCTIYSPIDGIVISRNVDEGQTVAASMTAPVLFTIANDLTRMQINSHVPEADIGGIREGQSVEFTVDAYPGRSFTGTVIQVRNAPILQQNVVTYDTVIEVANPDRLLKPGMTATVTIITEEKGDVLRVRNTALRTRLPDRIRPEAPPAPEDDGGEGTWRVAYRVPGGNPRGTVEALHVRTGMTDGLHTEILDGLEPGDVLVTGVEIQTADTGDRRGGSSLFGPSPAQY